MADPPAPDWPVEYLTRGQRGIQGWVQHGALMLALGLHRLQRAAGEHGAVAEIGVHHGRLFIALALLRDAEEPAIAVDVFERQDLNPDKSGRGDRAVFEASLARWGAAERTIILARDSMTLTPAEVLERAGPQGVRLFSVDGSHTLRHASSDLRLAEACLAPGGVILLDDIFHPHWPEVTEAALLHLRDPASRLAPLALCAGKLFLVRREDHAGWLERLDARMRQYAEVWVPVRFAGQACRAMNIRHDDGLFEQVGLPTQAQLTGAPAVLDFQGIGPPAGLLDAGWGAQERWGRWLAGPDATCRIPLPPGLVPRRLLLSIGAPLVGAAETRHVGLSLGGVDLAPIDLRGPAILWHERALPVLPPGQALTLRLRPDGEGVAILAAALFA
ncbi:MAG: class I SAM-dependent methyltransferase [Acetobacteraceae bacterium]|nr:class I SAM-dependent methyltransferase [Acetobacteraceae bacterium]